MLYLLTLGWPWFVSAAALGLVVGVATKPQGAGLISNKGFALLGIAIIVLLVAAVLADKFEGRTALTLDVALLAGCAYFLGVLGGGAIRAATSSKPTEKPKLRQAAAPIIQFNGGGVVRRAEATYPPSARVAPAPTTGAVARACGALGREDTAWQAAGGAGRAARRWCGRS